MKCPKCGNDNLPGAHFCDQCGTRLAEPEGGAAHEAVAAGDLTCPTCGAPIIAGEAFCDNCGAALEETLAAPMPSPPPPPSSHTGAGTTCPACGADVEPDQAFCDACGVALQPVQPPPPTPAARLVVVSTGYTFELPDKEHVLIGREDPVSSIFPDLDLTPHGGEEGGVSRRHVAISREGEQYYVEDLDSTNGTLLNHRRLKPGVREPLNPGDELRLGRVLLRFELPRADES